MKPDVGGTGGDLAVVAVTPKNILLICKAIHKWKQTRRSGIADIIHANGEATLKETVLKEVRNPLCRLSSLPLTEKQLSLSDP